MRESQESRQSVGVSLEVGLFSLRRNDAALKWSEVGAMDNDASL